MVSSRSIGARPIAAPTASIPRANARRNSRITRAFWPSPGRLSGRHRRDSPAAGRRPLLLAGMIGSNRGWKEAPYVPCPAGPDDLAKALVWAGKRRRSFLASPTSATGGPTSCAARRSSCSGRSRRGWSTRWAVCHPGTHNKWATLRHGKISEFRTVMTGELFSLLKDHSILSDLLQGKVERATRSSKPLGRQRH